MSLINGSGIVPLMNTVNDNLMFGWFGNLILIALFVILFMSFQAKSNNPGKALGFSALFVAIFSVMFRTMELVPDETVLICWIITAIAIIVPILRGD